MEMKAMVQNRVTALEEEHVGFEYLISCVR